MIKEQYQHSELTGKIISCKEQEIGTRRVDFLVEGKVMVELKAVTQLEDVHLAQARSIRTGSWFTHQLWQPQFAIQARHEAR